EQYAARPRQRRYLAGEHKHSAESQYACENHDSIQREPQAMKHETGSIRVSRVGSHDAGSTRVPRVGSRVLRAGSDVAAHTQDSWGTPSANAFEAVSGATLIARACPITRLFAHY